MMPEIRNVFDALPKMPKQVTILGTGPNGLPWHDRLEGFVIGVNGAINIRDLDIWLVGDIRATMTDYFKNPRCSANLRIFGTEVARVSGNCDLTFNDAISIGAGCRPIIESRRLKSGATIAGKAMQLAYFCGARRIALCGIDMSGAAYYDGTVNPNIEKYGNGIWGQLDKMKLLIAALGHCGCEVYSVSPTALKETK